MFGDHSGEFNRYGIRIFGPKVLTIKHWQSKRMFAISEEMDKILFVFPRVPDCFKQKYLLGVNAQVTSNFQLHFKIR